MHLRYLFTQQRLRGLRGQTESLPDIHKGFCELFDKSIVVIFLKPGWGARKKNIVIHDSRGVLGLFSRSDSLQILDQILFFRLAEV
jgi:hypothetical protein